MKIVSLTTFTIALFSLFTAGQPILAQQSDHQKPSVTINTDLVVTWAQVLDPKDGKVVKGLEIDDFVLREGGKPQQISLLKDGQPKSVVILVQELVPCGGYEYKLATEYSFRKNREALRQLGDDSEIALMVWDYDVALAQPMTTDHNLIADKLEDRNKLRNILRPRAMTPEGDLAEFARPGEAIYQAARYLDKTASPGRRKIIIVIAHAGWLDKWWHRRAAAEVEEMLEKTGTTVYGLYQDFVPGDVAEFQRLNRKDKDRRRGGTIEEFVERTGGSLLVGRTEESDELLIKLAGLIRSSYTIGYYPENSDFDGAFRRINLELSPGGKAKAGLVNIKTRSGYRAFRPSSIAPAETITDAAIRAKQKEGQSYSVVFLVQGIIHCCHEPLQLFTELSIQENRKALRQLGDNAESALMAWDYDTALVQPMTTDQNLIAHRLKDKNAWINALRPRSIYSTGGAAEFARPGEAVYRAAQYLEKNAAPGRRKIIIIIGYAGWLDKAHPHTAAEVKEMLEKTGTTVYGLYEDDSPGNVSEFQRLNQKDKKRRSGGTIEEFVEQTGGSILIGKQEEGDELLIKLAGLIRSGKTSPELSGIGQK
jgi:VWFA-related protein